MTAAFSEMYSEIFATALAHHREGRLHEAEQGYRKVLALAPGHADAHNNLGVLLNGQNKPAGALACFERLAEIEPGLPRSHANRGVALKALGRLADAEAAYRQAIQLDPRFEAAHNNLGNLLYNRGAYVEAQQAFEAACALNPKAVEYRFMLAKALIEIQRLDRAEAELRSVLADDPQHADAWGTLARIWGERHCPVEAQACFDAGLKVRPGYAGLQYNRGLARLLAGDLRGGFADYECRFDVPDFPAKRLASAKPVWDGHAQPGKVLLLHAEQGLGDTLQALRYLPQVAKQVGQILLLIQAPLKPVVGLPHNVTLLQEGESFPAYDLVCPLLSLPHLLGTDLNALPVEVPYLLPARAEGKTEGRAGWQAAYERILTGKPGLRVGFVWAGNPDHKNDHHRSLPFDQLRPLLELEGLNAYSLQLGARGEECRSQGEMSGLTDLSPYLNDFADTAAVLQQLDVLICVDTSIAHLAGGLGLPVWLLVPWMPDWRWLLERDDSPWYPSMRLFRQRGHGNWGSVITEVAQALKALLHPRSAEGKRVWSEADLLVEEGRGLLERNQAALAQPLFWKALRAVPHHPRASSALAIVAFRHGRATAAAAFGERACRFSPKDPEAFSNQGAYLKAAGRLPEAFACFEQGLALKPDYAGLIYNRGLSRLLVGDFIAGFADYEHRFDTVGFSSKRLKSNKPLWDGSAQPDKTLILHVEQGLGDSLQFVRYLPLVAKRVKRVLLMIQSPLKPLLNALLDLSPNVSVLEEGQSIPAFDLVCPLLSLPHLMATELASVPAEIPYLAFPKPDISVLLEQADGGVSSRDALAVSQVVDPEVDRVDAPVDDPAVAWGERFQAKAGLRVGFVWAGSPTHKNDHNRSLKLDALSPLFDMPGVAAYSLQIGPRSADIAMQGFSEHLTDLAPYILNFGDTAAALQHLDLLICVDTSIAHVAGGLGLPVWLMLPWMPDWRWMLERDETPWYPSMRLFRQPQHGDWHSVIAALTDALKALISPRSAEGKRVQAQAEQWLEAGRVMLERGDFSKAMPAFWQALRLCPTHAKAASALAVVIYQRHALEAAVAFGQRACRLNPKDAEAWSNLGAYLKAAKQLEASLACQQHALALMPTHASAQSNLSNTLGALGRWEESLVAARQAIRLDSKVPDYQYNLGIALRENAKFAEAHQAFEAAQRQPGGHVKAALHQAMVELLTGDFDAGWTHYESRWQQPDCKEKRSFTQPQWQGEDVAGKRVFVHAEQGFGDSFQFLRYVPLLSQRGALVSLMVQPELASLAARLPGNVEVVPSGTSLPDFDFHCPLLSLPRAFQTRLNTIPANTPYLTALPELQATWQKRLTKKWGQTPFKRKSTGKVYRVGLVWAGRPTHANDANRSMTLEALRPLLELAGIRYVSLQKGPAAQQIGQLDVDLAPLDLGSELNSFEDTAAVLADLDELISVDTAVAHLAGALGKPVRVLLPFIPDWRWLSGRDAASHNISPWYPGMHLYRQSQRGNWSDPIQRLCADVSAAAGQLNL